MTTAWEAFGAAVGSLLPIVDPVGTATVYVSLRPTAGVAVALRATGIATVILVLAGLLGARLLEATGLDLAAIRAAGGLLLLATAWRMVMAGPGPAAAGPGGDVAVFLLAIPLLAGPGCIATMLLLMTGAAEPLLRGAVLAALVAVQAVALLCLLLAPGMARLLGPAGIGIVARLCGLLLMALALQHLAGGLGGLWRPR